MGRSASSGRGRSGARRRALWTAPVVVLALLAGLLVSQPLLEAQAAVGDERLVSADVNGIVGNGASRDALLSADGRFVLFESSASNLVPDPPTSGHVHLYLKDRETGEVEWIDRAPFGDPDGAQATGGDLSADGRFVAFVGFADTGQYVEGIGSDQHGVVYRLDRETDELIAIAHPEGGATEFRGVPGDPTISDDGQTIAFRSNDPAVEPTLPATLPNNAPQTFVWQATAGPGGTPKVTWISRPTDGTTITNFNDGGAPVVSGDGSSVFFDSGAQNLIDGMQLQPRHSGFNGREVYRWDVADQSVELLSSTTVGGTTTSTGDSELGGKTAVSRDGSVVVLVVERADEFVSGITDDNGSDQDIVLFDRVANTRTLVSRQDAAGTTTCDVDSTDAAVSGNGQSVAFTSGCEHGEFGSNSSQGFVYRWDRARPDTIPTRAAVKDDGTIVREGGNEAVPTLHPTLDDRGDVVAFDSRALKLGPDTNVVHDVYAFTRTDPVPGDPRVSLDTRGAQLDQPSRLPATSDDGRFVAFLSDAIIEGGTPPQGPGTPGLPNTRAYLADRQTGEITQVPIEQNFHGATAVDLSGDGRFVVFAASDKTATSIFSRPIYRWDRISGELIRVATPSFAADPSLITDLSVSRNGSRVAFVFDATGDVQVYDAQPDGSGGNFFALLTTFGNRARGVSLSGDGTKVLWTDTVPQVAGMVTNARHADPNSPNAREVYRRDLDASTTILVSAQDGPGGLLTVDAADSCAGNFTDGTHHAISDDGNRMVFSTAAGAQAFAGIEVTDRNGCGPDVIRATMFVDPGEVAVAAAGPGRGGVQASSGSNPNSFTLLTIYGPAFNTGPRPETCPDNRGELPLPVITRDGAQVAFFATCPSHGIGAAGTTSGAGFVADVPGFAAMEDELVDSADVSSGVHLDPLASANGGSLLFAGTTTALFGGDTNAVADVYPSVARNDLTPPPLEPNPVRVSTASSGVVQEGGQRAVISDDGAFVAYTGVAPDGTSGVFRRPTSGGPAVRVDVGTTGETASLAGSPDLSADGRFVAFLAQTGTGHQLVPGVPVNETHEYWKDLDTGEVRLLDHTAGGAPGASLDFNGRRPSISDDGQLVTFASNDPNLDGPGHPEGEVYLWRAVDRSVTKISERQDGTAADRGSVLPVLSGDGHVVVFGTFSTNLVPAVVDTNSNPFLSAVDLVAVDLTSGTRTYLSAPDGTAAQGGAQPGGLHSVSADGRFVLFQTQGNLFPYVPGVNDGSGSANVLLLDRESESYQVLDSPIGGNDPCPFDPDTAGTSGQSFSGAVSGDGQVVVFTAICDELAGVENVVDADLYRWRPGQRPSLLSHTVGGARAGQNEGFFGPSLTADGSAVAFGSNVNLTAGESSSTDIYTVGIPAGDPVPNARDDVATMLPSETVAVPVLANDLGAFDPASLAVTAVTPATSTAAVVTTGPTPMIEVTGTADTTVTYSIADADGDTDTAVLTASLVRGTPLTLDLVAASPTPNFEAQAHDLIVRATNPTGAAVPGAAVTVVLQDPFVSFSGTATGAGWTCVAPAEGTIEAVPATPGERTRSCRHDGPIAAGATLPDLALPVVVVGGAFASPCDAGAFTGDRCTSVQAYNGTFLDPAGSASPPAVTEAFTVAGATLRAEIVRSAGDEPQAVGASRSYPLRIVNESLTDAVNPSVVVSEATSTFVSAGIVDFWSCDGQGGGTARCTFTGVVPAGATSTSIDLHLTNGDGVGSTLCPAAPALELRLQWADPAVGGAGLACFTVEDPGNPAAPDLAVKLGHGGVVPEGDAFVLEAAVANVGDTGTTGPVTATVSLPAGFTPVSTPGTDWSCALDTNARTATCTRTAPIGKATTASSIVLKVAVAKGAANGNATVTVSTAGDTNASNDTASDPLTIERADGSVDGALGLAIEGPDQIHPGETVKLSARVDNIGSTVIAGPHALSLSLPDGLPAGQRVAVDAGGDGWTCTQVTARGTRILRCSHPGAIAGGGSAPVLVLGVTGTELVAPASLDLPFTVTAKAQPGFRTSKRLQVVPALRALLGVDIDLPGPIVAGRTGPVAARVVNTGTGQTNGPVTLTVAPPSSGLSVASATGAGWTCTPAPTVSCTSRVALRPGNQTAPLTVTYAAAADAPTSVATARLDARSTDARGERTATATALVPLQGAAGASLDLGRDETLDRTDAEGRVSEPLVVRNVGRGLRTGTLTVVELLPAGARATGNGAGWTCVPEPDRLACARPNTTLAPGAAAPPVTIALDFAPSAAGTVAGVVGLARLGTAAATSAAGFAVPSAPPPAPKLAITADVRPNPLTRGAATDATVDVRNTGTAEQPAGSVIGVVLPLGSTGLAPTGTAGPALTCRSSTDGGRAVAACRLDAALAPGASLSLATPFTVADNAPDTVVLAVGQVRPPKGSTDALADAAKALSGSGATALTAPVTLGRSVTGLLAAAGPDQEVFDLTESPGKAPVATAVELDATGSHSTPGAPLTYAWSQVAGPAVRLTGGDTATPTFAAPRVRDADRVELTFTVAVGDGGTTRADTVTVVVRPAPNRPPVVTPISASAGVGSTPSAGERITLTAGATDPDGDPLSFTWRIAASDGDAAGATLQAKGRKGATLAWPAHAGFVTVEVTVDDGRHGLDTEVLTLGVPLPPVTVTAAGPLGEQAAGTTVDVHASVTGAKPDQVVWVWQQVSGPAVDPNLLASTTGPDLTFPAPAAAAPGDAVGLRVIATRGSGASASADDALVTVRLASTPGPTVAIVGPPALSPGAPGSYTATGTGAGPLRFQWTQSFGPAGAFSAATQATTEWALGRDAAAGLTVTVTDAGGRTASSTLPVVVGSPFVPPTGVAVGCEDAAGLFGRALASAAAQGRLAAHVGVADVDLGGLTVTDPCGSGTPRIDITDASFAAAGVVSGTGLTGFLTEAELCLTGGTLHLPADWGVSAVALGTASPICLRSDPTDPNPITGSATITGLPFLRLPDGVPPPVTTIDFPGPSLHVTSHLTVPTGGTVDVDATADLAGGTGAFTASIVVDDVVVLGQVVDLNGSVAGDAGGIDTFEVVGDVPGPVALLPGADLTDLHVTWDRTALAATGHLSIGGGALELDVAGRISDAQNWELTAAAAVGSAPLTPLPGLTVQPAALSGTVRNVAGAITFDVQASIGGAWEPVPVLHVRQLTAQLSNFAPPSDCPSVTPGSVWFRLAGSATVDVPGQPINVNAAVCAGLGGDAWSLGATATLGSWQPVAGIPVSVESLGLHVTGIGLSDIVIEATGGLNVSGVQLGALVQIDPIALTIVVDGFGDLSTAGLGLSPGSVGHIVLASADVPGFRFRDPVLAGVTGVRFGLSMFAGFAPDPGLNSFLSSSLHIPPVTALVLSAQLGGPDITLTAAITLGGDGLTLFSVCPSGGCPTPADATSLSLQSLAISISITGSISFAANANLHLPGSPDGASPPSDLSLTARLTIDLAGPAITLALFTSDGTWNGALGVAGLDLADLAIQGGVNFASPVPTPTVGFGATVVHLPASWAAPIGMPTNAAEQEPMSFVLNISQTAPIFALTIGRDDADNHPALKPLTAIGQADKLQIDFASVVIAPFGGTVGPYTFEPGLSFGFDATINGVAVSVGAHLGLLPTPSIDAHLSIGPMTISGVTLASSAVRVHLGADGFLAHLDTSVALPDGMPTLDVDLDVSVGAGGVRADLVGTIEDWSFGSFATLDTLTVELHAAMTSLASPPTASFSASGRGKVLGTTVDVSGGVGFSGTQLDTANLKVSAGSFTVGVAPVAVTVAGKGCDQQQGTADDGACVQVAFDKDATPNFSGSLDGSVTVAGLKASISGGLDGKGVNATGTLDAKSFGSIGISGRLYSGSTSALANTLEMRPDGTSVQVETGDFKLTSTAKVGKLKSFSVSASTMVGRLGGTAFVHADGSMVVGSTTVGVSTDLSFTTKLKFHAETTLSNLKLGALTLHDAGVTLDDVTGLDAHATVTVTGIGTATVEGGFTAPTDSTPMGWHLTVDADVAMLGISADGHLVVDSDDGFTLDVELNTSSFDFDLHATVSTTSKRWCISGDVDVTVVNPAIDGHIAFCNKAPNAAFKLSATAFGYTVGPFSIPSPQFSISKSFGMEGEDSLCSGAPLHICLGMSGSFDVDVTISSSSGVDLGNSNASFVFFADHYDLFGNWVRTNLTSVDVSIDEESGEACADLGFGGFGGEVCF